MLRQLFCKNRAVRKVFSTLLTEINYNIESSEKTGESEAEENIET